MESLICSLKETALAATKYHISRDGKARPCGATTKPCPLFGAEHGDFETEREAERWADAVNIERAGGERKFWGGKKRESQEDEAEEILAPIDLTRTDAHLSREHLEKAVIRELDVFPHDLVVRTAGDSYDALKTGEEIYVNRGDFRVAVYAYDAYYKHPLSTELTRELKPVAIIPQSTFTEANINYHLKSDSLERFGARRILEQSHMGKVQEISSPTLGRLYKVHDGIEDRYYSQELKDVSEQAQWEGVAGALRSRDTESIGKLRAVVSSPVSKGWANQVASARAASTVPAALKAKRASKPRQTTKWHGEQPITPEINEIYSKVPTAERAAALSGQERVAFIEKHGKLVLQDATGKIYWKDWKLLSSPGSISKDGSGFSEEEYRVSHRSVGTFYKDGRQVDRAVSRQDILAGGSHLMVQNKVYFTDGSSMDLAYPDGNGSFYSLTGRDYALQLIRLKEDGRLNKDMDPKYAETDPKF